MRFLLDPGHGGSASGAVYDGAVEKDLTLAICLRAARTLRALGHEALLTRDRDLDLSLSARSGMIERYQAEAFISVHCNAAPEGKPGPSGCETYYRDDKDFPLANCLQQIMATYTGGKDSDLYQDERRLGKRLAVLSNSPETPAALVEVGYLSNEEERNYIIENLNTLGDVIAHGADWFAALREGRVKEAWPA